MQPHIPLLNNLKTNNHGIDNKEKYSKEYNRSKACSKEGRCSKGSSSESGSEGWW